MNANGGHPNPLAGLAQILAVLWPLLLLSTAALGWLVYENHALGRKVEGLFPVRGKWLRRFLVIVWLVLLVGPVAMAVALRCPPGAWLSVPICVHSRSFAANSLLLRARHATHDRCEGRHEYPHGRQRASG